MISQAHLLMDLIHRLQLKVQRKWIIFHLNQIYGQQEHQKTRQKINKRKIFHLKRILWKKIQASMIKKLVNHLLTLKNSSDKENTVTKWDYKRKIIVTINSKE